MAGTTPELRDAVVEAALESRTKTMALSDREFQYELETGVWAHAGAYQPWEEPFRELVGIVERHSHGGPSVYMDATTVWTAFRLTDGDASILSALTLMDLEKVTRSVVLDDHIFHLPNESLDPTALNSRLGDEVFVALDPVNTQPAVDRVLWDIWYYSAPDIVNTRGGSSLASHWENVLDQRLAEDSRRIFGDLSSLLGIQLGEDFWSIQADGDPGIFSSDPVVLVRNLTEEDYAGQAKSDFLDHLDEDTLNRILKDSASTRRDLIAQRVRELVHRATFHQLLSEALGLTYDPSFVRMPAIAHLTRNSIAIARAFADISAMDGLSREKLSSVQPDSLFASVSRIRLPRFASYALSRSHSLDEWWEVVAELRRRSGGYRRRRNELQEALLLGDVRTITKLRDEMSGASEAVCTATVDAALDVGAAAAEAGATLLPGSASVFGKPAAGALSLVLARPVAAAVSALRRRLNPQLRLYYDVTAATAGYLHLENKIRLLWHTDTLPRSIHRLDLYGERIRALNNENVISALQ